MNILYAIDETTKKSIYIQHAESGKAYYCSTCKGVLFARKGIQNQHHFYHHVTNVTNVTNNCIGTNESTTHRSAKNRLQAFLRRGIKIRVYSCEQVCSLECFTEIKRLDTEKVEVEFPFRRLTEGNIDLQIADVALVDKETNIARILFEVKYSHATTNRPEPWFELDADEINNSKSIRNNILHLNEERPLIPESRNCIAHTFQEKLWLAGLNECSLGLSDTLDKNIEEQWKNNVMQESHTDPEYPSEYQLQLLLNTATKQEKIRLYAEHYPEVYNLLDWCNDAKRWAKIYTTNYASIKRARKYIQNQRKCIGCQKKLADSQDWKILCIQCWKERKILNDLD